MYKSLYESFGQSTSDQPANVVSFEQIDNITPQRSFIVKIVPPDHFTTERDIIVVGAHMDSTIWPLPQTLPGNFPKSLPGGRNQSFWDSLVAPGADDNASSLAMLVEVARAVGYVFAKKEVHNEVHFHFWSAEEIGLVGSRSVFAKYRNESKSVKAVLNFDMVGWPGEKKEESPRRITVHGGNVHVNLTAFTKKIVDAYSEAEAVDYSCGYVCSDHASAWENGFPSAALSESGFLNQNTSGSYPYIHTPNDTIAQIKDFDYILEFAKVAAGFLVELAFTNFTELNRRAGIN